MNDAGTSSEAAVGRSPAFTTTHWSVVLEARQEDTTKALAALEKLCRTYWYPLYAYVRRRGYSKEDSQDLAQGFFASFLKGQAIARIEEGPGTFRSYLLTSLNHFLVNEYKKQKAQKRGGGQSVISLDAKEAERCYQLEPADNTTPEKLYERRWATTLINNALGRLEGEFADTRKAALFEELCGFVVEGVKERSYAEMAQKFGVSEEALRQSVSRLRSRYRQVIREEIAETVSTPGEVEEELRALFSALSSE